MEARDLIEDLELQVPLHVVCARFQRPPYDVMFKVASLVFDGEVLAISPDTLDALLARSGHGHIQNRERIGVNRRESHG